MKITQQRLPRVQLIAVALLIGVIGTYLLISSRAAVACDQTVSSVSAAQSAVGSATGGKVICMSAGTYGRITLQSIAPSSTVTLQPAPGAKVTLGGLTLTGPGDTKNITVQGFYFNAAVMGLCGITGNVVFQYNTIQNIARDNAFYFYANGCGNGHTQSGVSMLNNQIDHVGDCLTVAGGAGIEKNFTFKDNVCGPGIGAGVTQGNQYSHYVEVGCLDTATINNNAFLGPYDAAALSITDPATAVHNNVFHCFGSGNDIEFSNNILWHTQSRAQTILIQEGKFDNIKLNNNLFVNDPKCINQSNNCPSMDIEVYTPRGLEIKNNTVVATSWGLQFPVCPGNGCYATGSNATFTNNVVEGAPTPGYSDYGPWQACSSSCITGNNVSYDSSALGTPSVKNWTPSYTTTNWTPKNGEPYSPPPNGYYVATGLPFSAGWDGSGGPRGGVGAAAFDGAAPPASSDTAAPTVSLTAPAGGSTVSGSSATVSASASDDTGVTGVQFKLDGNNLGSEDTSSPYSTTWNTTTATNGTHTLTAVARDAAGNTKTSSSVTVTVSNGTASGIRYVATNGSDSGNNCLTKTSPCLTFSRAYNQATLGDTVEVAAGTYGNQTIGYVNSSPKNNPDASLADVVFRPAAGAAVTTGTIEVEAFHVTVQDMKAQDTNIPYDGPVAVHDVTFKNMDARNFTIDSGVDINILGGDYGPSSACGGSYGGGNNGIRKNNATMPSNILIDGVNLHDVQSYDLVACHIECLIIGAGNGLTIRNSTFRNCSIFDIFLQPFNGTISNVLIENNWFGQPTGTDGSTNSGRAVEFSTRSPWNANWSNVTVRNNSFNTALNIDDDTSSSYSTYTNFKVTGNILERSSNSANTCNASVQYAYNVWKNTGCGSSTDISAGGTLPYVNTSNGANFDYHLKPGTTVGLNLVPSNQAPADDIDGEARPQGTNAEAGSDEISGGGGTPSDTTNPTVSFGSPANNATVSGTVTATANASDNVGVTKVEISLDGSLKMTDTSSPYNYSFDSKTLSNGSHTLSAKAYDAAGNTATTTITVTVNNTDTTPPSVPSGLNATAANATTVNLTWNASTDTGTNASGMARYNVLRNGGVIAQPTGTSYTDTTAVANTTYSYTVQAVDAAGNVSASSTADSVTTPGAVDTTAPGVPGSVTATAASTSQVNVSWHASTDSGGSGLAGYNVYRNGTKLNNSLITGTSYGDSTVSANTTYSYRVEAVDGSGNKSAQSTAVSVKTPAVVRGDITGANGTPDGKVDLFDISYVIRNYNTTNASADISGPNGTPDGKVDLFDISYVIRNYGN